MARASAHKWSDQALYLLMKAFAFGAQNCRARARKNGNAIIGLTLEPKYDLYFADIQQYNNGNSMN